MLRRLRILTISRLTTEAKLYLSDDLHQQHWNCRCNCSGVKWADCRPVCSCRSTCSGLSDKAERASGDIFLVWMEWATSGDGFARFGVDARNRDFLRYLIRLVRKVLMRGVWWERYML
jgi:hypothetical protein